MSKKAQQRAIGYSLYFGFLAAFSFLIYGTLFIKAYSSSSLNGPSTVVDNLGNSQTDSQASSAHPAESIVYTTYPKEDETVATVLLDAGHGGIDGGNVNNGVLEKDMTLDITLKVAQYLNELNPNIEVRLTRDSDATPWFVDELSDLNYRLEQQTVQNADYFFSFHTNAFDDPSVEGVVFFVNETDTVMNELVNDMIANMKAIDWAQNYGVIDTTPLQVVTMSDIHSTLIELGYMTNPANAAHLMNETELNYLAKAIAATISDYIMQHPDAPEYEKPQAQKDLEASMRESDVSGQQSSVDNAAANAQAQDQVSQSSVSQ